jgi:1,4-dihydroxy-2-naphthoyl-CoA hydrolase
MSELPIDLVATLNGLPGWVRELGLVVSSASVDEVVGHFDVLEKHHQAYGIVHGGVHCGIVETMASIGAAMVALPRGQRVVGLENSTSFIRAVRAGRLHARARPLTRGRRSQAWHVEIRDEAGQLVAEGKVRLLCLEQEKAV